MLKRILYTLIATIVLFALGSVLAARGEAEAKVSALSTPEPLEVDLAQLEGNDRPQNCHLNIGPHYACYFCTVYSYRRPKNSTRDPEATTPLTFAYYPIVSRSNPEIQNLAGIENAADPDDEPEPPALPTGFSVLVKTTRFKTLGDLPTVSARAETGVEGLVINILDPIQSDERKLIQDQFPNLDMNKILILEEGRKPSTATTAKLMIYGGLAAKVGAGLVPLGMLLVTVMGMIRRDPAS